MVIEFCYIWNIYKKVNKCVNVHIWAFLEGSLERKPFWQTCYDKIYCTFTSHTAVTHIAPFRSESLHPWVSETISRELIVGRKSPHDTYPLLYSWRKQKVQMCSYTFSHVPKNTSAVRWTVHSDRCFLIKQINRVSSSESQAGWTSCELLFLETFSITFSDIPHPRGAPILYYPNKIYALYNISYKTSLC